MQLVREVKIQKIHAFPFSAHEMGESVPAGKFPEQIDDKTKKLRLKQLIDQGEKIRHDFILSQQKKPLKVLIESVQ